MKRTAPIKGKQSPDDPSSLLAAQPPIVLEDALKELEGIVQRLEDPSTALETAIQQYSRGMDLSRACAQRLAGLERQILLVQRGPQGEAVLEDFEPEEAGDADPA
jgi:exodeoxyribonuclease VII small subunit